MCTASRWDYRSRLTRKKKAGDRPLDHSIQAHSERCMNVSLSTIHVYSVQQVYVHQVSPLPACPLAVAGRGVTRPPSPPAAAATGTGATSQAPNHPIPAVIPMSESITDVTDSVLTRSRRRVPAPPPPATVTPPPTRRPVPPVGGVVVVRGVCRGR